MDDEQKTGEEQEIPKKEEPIVIPPENPSQVSVPPEFASPTLFQKDADLPSNTSTEESLPQEKKSHAKTIIMIVILVIGMAVGTVTIVNVLVEKKFETFLFDENDQFVSEGFELSEGETESETPIVNCEGGSPFIEILGGEQTLVPGETNTFSWKLCGIGENLFDSATISYYPLDEETKEGSFSLDCLAPLGGFTDGVQTIDWDVPPFLEASSSPAECSPPTINFLNTPYRYTLSVSYASGQYEDTSEYFLIDGTNYTYVPPQFEDYQIVPDTSFDRSPFIDASAPEFLKEVIFPAYFEAPPLFANYYRWYVIPNGPSFLIDLRDGKVYDAPGTGGQIIGKPYSSLFVAFEEKEDDTSALPQTHVVRWSLFDEESKTFNLIEEKLCTILLQGEPEISDCVPKL